VEVVIGFVELDLSFTSCYLVHFKSISPLTITAYSGSSEVILWPNTKKQGLYLFLPALLPDDDCGLAVD